MNQFDADSDIRNQSSCSENDNGQHYIEIEASTFLGTKDGKKYTLIQTSENKFRLCESTDVENLNLSSCKGIWCEAETDENRNTPLAADTATSAIKMLSSKMDGTPCKGQGDEPENSNLITPDSTSRLKSPENKDSFEGSQIKLNTVPQLTYTTLVPKQENINVSYLSPPGAYFNQSPVLRTPIATKPMRFVKSRPRMKVAPYENNCSGSPIIHSIMEKPRQRKSKQNWYQYNPPLLHSTPIGASNACLSSNSSDMSLDTSGSTSSGRRSESDASFHYPRVPNNTPTTIDEDLSNKSKLFDMQWYPRISSQTDFIPMDSRETHNEKERKRRLRIKNSCQFMRELLPFVTEKTDNATVFENAVRYISFLKETIGNDYDLEFLKCNCSF